jgi:hypothetical protein
MIELVLNDGAIHTGIGRMELRTSYQRVVQELIRELKTGRTLSVSLVENSKHHHADMLVLCDEDGLTNLEISEHGVFPYQIDDGVS